jgi:K(+)-stimulated pyrophosphate-energized sodium pump
VVEAGHDYFLRHAGGRADSGTGEGVYLDRIAARERSRDLGAGGRRVARHSVGIRGGQFLRLLSGIGHDVPDVDCLLHEHAWDWELAAGMLAPAVFAFGLVAFGFLGMGPVTIAVDSYGPVTDNAQSVYELSMIEQVPNVEAEIKKDFNIRCEFRARQAYLLEANDGAGNTFKATAKPVLIGTAVVGATTMIFSIIMALTTGSPMPTWTNSRCSRSVFPRTDHRRSDDLLVHRRFHAGRDHRRLSRRRVHQSQHQTRRCRESLHRRQQESGGDLHEVCAEGHVEHLYRGVLRTLAFAFVDPFFFVGYLISIAIFGLYQAIFMANAGAAWDNAKKIVEVEMKQKGTPLHDATVIGDTVGDPFKDTSSVALNPVIKFTTLFGLLAVELAVKLAVIRARR